MNTAAVLSRHQLVGLLVAGAAVALTPGTSGAAESGEKPNIIYILFDDLGYGQPPSFGVKSPATMPNFDKLSRQGVRFTNAHTAAAICTPTRYGLITGQYPWRVGIHGVGNGSTPPQIAADRMTVGKLMQNAGYTTAVVGKWHLGMNGPKEAWKAGDKITEGPTARGFDHFLGYTHANGKGGVGGIECVVKDDAVEKVYRAEDVLPRLVDGAEQWVEKQAKAKKPFFLYFPLPTPHSPIVPHPSFKGKAKGEGKMGKGPYADWVTQGDDAVGRMMDAVERLGVDRNTLIVATSDNGCAAEDNVPPLRGKKFNSWEGGVRVAFAARWPAMIKPGTSCDDPISLNSLLATCAELTGQKLPDDAGEDSFSILPLLKGEAKGPTHNGVIAVGAEGPVIVRGDWKYFVKRKELYRTLSDADIGETTDVASGHLEVVSALAARYEEIVKLGRSTPGAPQGQRKGNPSKGQPDSK